MHEYCDVNDLTHFWRAWRYHPAGRSFPVLMRHMLELTLNFTFHQCHLARDWRLEPGTHCVHPRCQCAGQTVPERAIKVTLKLNSRRRRRTITVPEWVIRNKLHVKVEPFGDLVDCAPRDRTLPVENRAPLRLQGESRFHQAAENNRCVANPLLCSMSTYP